MTMLRHASKVAAGVLPAALVARLGLPALGALVFLALVFLAAGCWVVRSRARTDRVSRMLLALRGNANCLGPGTTPSSPAAARPRRQGNRSRRDITKASAG